MRPLRTGLIVLAVLGVLGVAADRVAVGLAEGEVAERARSGLELEAEPGVAIQGFPFLTQVLADELEHVDVDLRGYPVQVDEQRASMETLDLTLRSVEIGDGYSAAVAREAEGTGRLGYDELTRLADDGGDIGVQLGYGGDGLVALRVAFRGLAVGPEMTADLVAEGDVVRLRVRDMPSLEEIPLIGDIPGMEDRIRQMIDRDRQVRGLPEGLELSGITATEEGLELALGGTDVVVTGGS